jgi:hypothetical protein
MKINLSYKDNHSKLIEISYQYFGDLVPFSFVFVHLLASLARELRFELS